MKFAIHTFGCKVNIYESEYIINLLQDNTQLKVYIQENSKYGVNSTYLFSVNNGNFNSIYYDFYINVTYVA